MTPTAQILELIASFPCLRNKVRHYQPIQFDADHFWKLFAGASHGERLCALFILNIWNPGYAVSQGWRFDLFEFIGCADGGNRSALIAWMENPFWP
jgi:hypothetical protein